MLRRIYLLRCSANSTCLGRPGLSFGFRLPNPPNGIKNDRAENFVSIWFISYFLTVKVRIFN